MIGHYINDVVVKELTDNYVTFMRLQCQGGKECHGFQINFNKSRPFTKEPI